MVDAHNREEIFWVGYDSSNDWRLFFSIYNPVLLQVADAAVNVSSHLARKVVMHGLVQAFALFIYFCGDDRCNCIFACHEFGVGLYYCIYFALIFSHGSLMGGRRDG